MTATPRPLRCAGLCMGSGMPDAAFDHQPLGTLFRLSAKPVFPSLEPSAEFHHHSLPAWDSTGRPAIESGSSIESNKVLVDEPAVLVSKLNPRKPRVAVVVPRAGERHCASTEFMCFLPRNPNEDLSYWAYYLGSNTFSLRLQRVAIGSTNSHTRASPSEVIRWTVPNPPNAQKRVIAQVLDTLDTTIRQTEEIIEKLKQIKQGLLHDLLTRGIDANGELRQPQSQAPHLYKDSPLGWIPVDWTACALGTALDGIDGGWSPDCHEVPPPAGRWGVLKLSAITSGRYLPSESKTLPDTLRPDPSIEVHTGDVLLARANGVVELVATTVFVDSTPDRLMLSDKTLRLRPAAETLSSKFLALLMAFDPTRRQIRGMLSGSSGQQNISQRQIGNLAVALPSFNEQQVIEARIAAAEVRILAEVKAAEKLREAKSGLMDDLLTGRVRVTPLLEAAGA